MDIPRTAAFLADLSANNTRTWFEANRAEYRLVRDDFYAFLGELIEQIGEFDPSVREVKPRSAAFRMFRDTRFSADKSPYRTVFSAAISEAGRGHEAPGYFVQVDAKGAVMYGGGIFMPTAPVLARIREHLARHPERLRAVLDAPGFAENFGEIQGERLKRPPRGYDENAPMLEHLKLRSFIGMREVRAPDSPTTGRIAAELRTLHPLVAWVSEGLATTR